MLTTQDPDPNQKRPFLLFRPFLALWTWLVPPTQAHIDRQSWTARFVFLGLMVAIASGLVVFTLLNARTWHHAWKHWLSDRDAATAEKYEKEMMDYAAANRKMEYEDAGHRAVEAAKAAYLGDPDNPAAIRVLARLYTQAGWREASYFWGKLEKAHELTDEDFGWRVKALARAGQDKSAGDQIESLLKETKPTRKVVETADDVMRHLGRSQQLLVILKKYVADKPDDSDTRLLLGMREMQFGTAEDKKEGRTILWEMAAMDDDTGMHALHFLASQKDLTVEEQKRLIDRLEHHPDSKEAEHIAALRLKAHLPGADKGAIVDKAIADHANASRDDLVILCRWLLDEGEFEKVATFLKGKENQIRDYNTPLLDHYLTALTRLNRFDDLQRLVEDPRVNLTTADRAFHRVHLAYVLGKPEEEMDKLLVEAVDAAINQHQLHMLLDLGHYAEQRKHYRTAWDAYRAASTNPDTEKRGYDGMLSVSYLMGNTKEFSATAQETARRWPDSQYYLERSLYASLISGVEMETAIARAQKLFEARPSDSQRKILMGLAHFRMGDTAACRRVLEGVNLEEISPGQRAVLCGLIRGVGLTRQAYELSQTIPDSTVMLPEEANFLRRAKIPPVDSVSTSGS
jgi:hypothetical protein